MLVSYDGFCETFKARQGAWTECAPQANSFCTTLLCGDSASEACMAPLKRRDSDLSKRPHKPHRKVGCIPADSCLSHAGFARELASWRRAAIPHNTHAFENSLRHALERTALEAMEVARIGSRSSLQRTAERLTNSRTNICVQGEQCRA